MAVEKTEGKKPAPPAASEGKKEPAGVPKSSEGKKEEKEKEKEKEKEPTPKKAPASKTSSQASEGSTASKESAGIGADLNKTPANPDGAPCLTPEGFGLDANIKAYDAILYLIYCPEHDKVAVTNVERARCVFLPFVFLPEGVTWRQAAEEGVLSVISARDKEADAAVAAKSAPAYDMEYLNILRLQLPSEKFITRLVVLVVLKKSAESDFKCCTRSPRINWLRAVDIIEDRIDKVWGGEVKSFTRLIGELGKNAHEAVISEFTVQNSLHFLLHTGTPKNALLVDSAVKNEHVLELYEDFIEHCYPSFAMVSFYIFLNIKLN